MLLFGLCVLVLLIQIGYWIAMALGFRRAVRLSAELVRSQPEEPVSVVVAARNESPDIAVLIGALADQSVRPQEVILVDDGSTDGTSTAASAAAAAYSNLPCRVLSLENVGGNKKAALSSGIGQARCSVVALTDGDCAPRAGWLGGISRAHRSSNGSPIFLVGYSPYRRGSGLLNRVARYETFVTGVMTAAAIGLGRPYMAVGRNLSYRKETFQAVGGFDHSRMVRSGDDDLLLQHVARAGVADVRPMLEPGTFVDTDAPDSWYDWLRQKRRHVSAARFYSPGASLHLALFQAGGIATWSFPFLLGWWGAALLFLRLIVQFVVLDRAAKHFDERDLSRSFYILEPLYVLYNAIVVPLSLLKMPRRW